jgi:hypothetical protein
MAPGVYLRLRGTRIGFVVAVCQENRGTKANGVAARLEVGDSLLGEILAAATERLAFVTAERGEMEVTCSERCAARVELM